MEKGSVLKGNAIFEKYIRKNVVKYIFILSVYIIGFLIGIGSFNKSISNEKDSMQISYYVAEKIETIGNELSNSLASYIKQDFLELIIICTLSFSIIGIPIIILILFFNAISLAITISSIIYTTGIGCGLSFSILMFLIPVIIKIFIYLILVCSSLKFIENILKYKKEFKYEMVRHAIVNLLSLSSIFAFMIYRTFALNIVSQILF